MSETMRIAVVGAGLIGKCHVQSIAAAGGADLACIVDPSGAAKAFAQTCGVAWYSNLDEMFRKTRVDGAILATPSQLHGAGGLDCVARGCPVLVEKPLCSTVADAEALVAAGRAAGVPILTGHHRRHGAVVKTAKSLIDGGALGRVVSFHATCWFHKPADYFDVAWRSQAGGGPLAINLIHDIDTALHLFGDVAHVQAMAGNQVRGGAMEDTAAVLLRFESGVLGTLSVSDTAVSPWSWETTSGENPAYPVASESCYWIGGTKGALSLPDMTLWRHHGEPSWVRPLSSEAQDVETVDPLVAQIEQFVAVIRGEAEPLVSGQDGLRTVQVIEAIRASITTGERTEIDYGAPAAS